MEPTMHVLIADDEAPARSELLFILQSLAPEARFCEAMTGDQVLQVIEREPIQVVFLDIDMPGLDGLTVAATIMDGPEPPLVVFATAYNEHSVRAFELAALDYVLKPFDERRLAKMMERVRRALEERAVLAEKQAALRGYLALAAPAEGLSKLWCERSNASRLLADYGDILWVAAENKDTFVQTRNGERLRVRRTLQDLETRLSSHHFVRIHKAYLVNLDHVAEVAPWFSGAYQVRIADAGRTQIPMSRRYALRLKRLTDWK